MQPGRTTNTGGGTMEMKAAALRCQLLLILLMSAVMLLPGTKGSLLLVQRTVTRTIVLQETIGKAAFGTVKVNCQKGSFHCTCSFCMASRFSTTKNADEMFEGLQNPCSISAKQQWQELDTDVFLGRVLCLLAVGCTLVSDVDDLVGCASNPRRERGRPGLVDLDHLRQGRDPGEREEETDSCPNKQLKEEFGVVSSLLVEVVATAGGPYGEKLGEELDVNSELFAVG
ncbi:hypothetical protein STEG23_019505, partial [Scotinomys teguina]